MALNFPRRAVPFAGVAVESWLCRSFCSRAGTSLDQQVGKLEPDTPCDRHKKGPQPSIGTRMNLSPLVSESKPPPGGYSIEVVDAETWRVSAGLGLAWHGNPGNSSGMGSLAESVEETKMEGDDDRSSVEGGIPDADFDEIDNMRIRGNLFYKLEKASKEFDEYAFDFHRKKSPKRREGAEEVKEKERPSRDDPRSKHEKLQNVTKKLGTREEYARYEPNDSGNVKEVEKKKLRVPTFNELTGPYHEPFCLDIFISNASVRACIVHRVTSNVVVVAHSISKDMKFDLSSTRNARACEAVGEVLAQRALADDIHDVVYTPRRGEVLEGKLGIVVRAITENGVRVKLKLKQRRQKGGNTHRSF